MDISFLPHMSMEHKAAGWTEEGISVLCSLGDNQASVIGSVQSMEDTVLLNVGTGSQVSMGISGYRKCGGNIELRPCLPGRNMDPETCGRIEGIRTENFHPGAMTAGMLLGILEELYGYYEEMCRLAGHRASILAGSGNGLRKNPLMRRLAEEMFGLPLKVTAYEEEAACGAALHAMAGIGAAASVEEAQKKISYL